MSIFFMAINKNSTFVYFQVTDINFKYFHCLSYMSQLSRRGHLQNSNNHLLKHALFLFSRFLLFMKEPELHSEVWEYLLQLSSNIDAANKKSLQCCLLSLIQSLDHFLDNFSNVTFAQKTTTCTISQNRGWYQCCYIVLNLIWNILCTSCSKGKGYTVTLLSLLSWYQILSRCTHFKVHTMMSKKYIDYKKGKFL